MSGERFLDDLARMLAQPMPRRRAIRVIGASLAAIAIPGVSPRKARAVARTHAQTCGPGQLRCTNDLPERKFDFYCCEWPQVCGPVIGPGAGTCVTECPFPSLRKKQKPCVSAKDRTKHACCVEPFSRCDPGHPDLCLPDCKLLLGKGAIDCGRYCCPPGHRCAGKGKCVPCSGGREGCGSTCCNKGQHCSSCLERDAADRLIANGAEKCCGRDEKCCENRCCRKKHQCCGNLCCDFAGKGEQCTEVQRGLRCCPNARALKTFGLPFCCPAGTVALPGGKGCCRPGELDCCPPRDNVGNVLACGSLGKICVNGACVRIP